MTHALAQLHIRDAVGDGQRLSELVRDLVNVVRTSAREGEIVAADRHRTPVELSKTHDVSTRGEPDDVALIVVLRTAHQPAHLDERTRIGHLRDPLAHRVAAA